jgi:hypothetical protein
MKRKFNYLLPVLLVTVLIASGCLSNKKAEPGPVPAGIFKGQFTRLHASPGSTTIDTLKAAVVLTLNAGGTFTVTGDTAVVHAGSKGKADFNTTDYIVSFDDDTYPKTGKPAKVHLSGLYQYLYQGNVFQMISNRDTISLRYDLKRVN